MDRATIRGLAVSMLQNRSAATPAHIDAMLDSVYSHLLVDEVPSLARRGVEVVVTADGVATYTLSEVFRTLDADYAYLDSGERLPVYGSREQWLVLEAAPGDVPSRLLLFNEDDRWKVLLAPTPSSAININIPATFYRGVLPDEGVVDSNEALAIMYGTAMQMALIAGLSDIVTAAQAGANTHIDKMKSRAGSERWTPTQLPPRRDF